MMTSLHYTNVHGLLLTEANSCLSISKHLSLEVVAYYIFS